MTHQHHTSHTRRTSRITKPALVILAFATAMTAPSVASADVVTDWNQTMIEVLANTPPPPSARVGAIVQSSVFDAANGIEPHYTPVHVTPAGPRGASRAAAAAGAAHEALVALFPGDKTMLDQRLAQTLAQIPADSSIAHGSISRGLQCGQTVADEILAWRAADGFAIPPAPYVLTGLPGRWAPTSPTISQPLFRQFATMTPFALTSPAQFLPEPPPSLTSARYAVDLSEVKALGGVDSTVRTPEQTETAVFWQADTPTAIWNRVADQLATQRSGSLLSHARILALMNIGLLDTTIAIWNAKNFYDTWRPITAIQQAANNGNPDVTPDPSWTPLLPTPAFQEYPAGHPGVSNAAAAVLSDFYGNDTSFTTTSAGLPGVSRSFTSFSNAVAQVEDARVWGGIHFRAATIVGAQMGSEVAQYLTSTHLIPIHGHHPPHGTA